MFRRVYEQPPAAPQEAGDYLLAILDLRDNEGDIIHLWLNDRPDVFLYRWVFPARHMTEQFGNVRRMTYAELANSSTPSLPCFVKILDEALLEHAHKQRLGQGAKIAAIVEGKCGR